MYKLSDPHVYKLFPDKSESHYAVIFNQGAWQGSSKHFGVFDESKSESKLIILGTLNYNDLPLKLQRVVLSTDKSVIAAESYFSPAKRGISYWLAYDFTNSISY